MWLEVLVEVAGTALLTLLPLFSASGTDMMMPLLIYIGQTIIPEDFGWRSFSKRKPSLHLASKDFFFNTWNVSLNYTLLKSGECDTK